MLGYACINTELRANNVFTNRTMRKKTFLEKGLPYVSQLSLQNCRDLLSILQWNETNNIRFFRISSNLFPWCSEYSFYDLPDVDEIFDILQQIGKFAKEKQHRLTFHPDHFCKLASPKEEVLINTIKELEFHSFLMDCMGLSNTTYNKINIHVGATYGDKEETAKRFCLNFCKLSSNLQSRLTVENDDRASLFSAYDLYTMIHKFIDIPIVFDYHHHRFCSSDLNEVEALEMSLSTWQDVKPATHYSDSRQVEQNDTKIKPQAHSDYIFTKIDTYNLDFDIMLESKMKEKALLLYRDKIQC